MHSRAESERVALFLFRRFGNELEVSCRAFGEFAEHVAAHAFAGFASGVIFCFRFEREMFSAVVYVHVDLTVLPG